MSSVESTKRGRSGARLLAGRKPDALPAFVPPCLATLADAPPEGADWVHEIKLDGYRLEARIANGSVQLLTRTGLDWTGRFPSIAKALKGLRVKSALIDGEAVVEDAHGVTSFAALVEALAILADPAERSANIAAMAADLGVDERLAGEILDLMLGPAGWPRDGAVSVAGMGVVCELRAEVVSAPGGSPETYLDLDPVARRSGGRP